MTAARRPPLLWLSLAGALVGLAIVAARVAALPDSRLAQFLVAVGLALVVSGAIVGVRLLLLLRRLDAAGRAFPGAVTMPVTVGAETAAGSRWLAHALGDPALELTAHRSAVIAIDGAGIHVVGRAVGTVPAAAVSHVGEARTLVGIRERDAVELTIVAGTDTAPLRLVPRRVHGNPWRPLDPAERHATIARIGAALRGEPVEPGWRS